tara:strand:+ start:732 stop:863 length:132 start_codon:yes stop_codon:yes gene_type:complete
MVVAFIKAMEKLLRSLNPINKTTGNSVYKTWPIKAFHRVYLLL